MSDQPIPPAVPPRASAGPIPYAPPPVAPPSSGGRLLGWLVGLVGVVVVGVGLLIVVGVLAAVFGEGSGGSSGWNRPGPKVGVVTMAGPITDESIRPVVEQLGEMVDNDDVSAIVLRIESPGGGIAPSQELFQTVRRLSEKKPIVASMGQLAASGGYYIALGARRIYANPGTLTGSIGVIAQTVVIRRLLEDTLGMNPHTYTSGRLKDTMSGLREPTAEDEAFIRSLIAEFYDQYADDVLAVRNVDPREVAAIREAQVITGRQAKELGLIDELGGLRDAAVAALAQAGIENEEPVLVRPRRRGEDFLKQLLEGSVDRAFDRVGIPDAANSPLQWRAPF